MTGYDRVRRSGEKAKKVKGVLKESSARHSSLRRHHGDRPNMDRKESVPRGCDPRRRRKKTTRSNPKGAMRNRKGIVKKRHLKQRLEFSTRKKTELSKGES